MANIGFSGTSNGMTADQKAALRTLLRTPGITGELHHGDCVGADAEAHEIAQECGLLPILHPPSNYAKRAWCESPAHLIRPEKPYLARNRDIVDETTVLIAAPAEYDEQPRGGTWHTVRYARKQGRPIALILPNGIVRRTHQQR